ncbi:SRPBCC domain-containing protein [Acinetobacter wuhouensis]|uniref:ATPase n=1 Tax=Acinetobacter wuhouensis TaxID=1879050 RepID=A0A4Q7AH07_9GAMM|nr:SRPBCC domain-containing protein [Acinetobacter wuhouensis]RZG44598.1 ATPase [Acinetobacter wuhouensis]RZG73931.1 ATPase [Acinetobacter wuhouensis]
MARIEVQSWVYAPIDVVWNTYNNPQDIQQWNTASPDWHTINSQNDLRVGGQFSNRMEAKDGSMGFDFAGVYTEVILHEKIAYSFGERNAEILFQQQNEGVLMTITFDPENQYPLEQQQAGWQAILDNFKRYVESKS